MKRIIACLTAVLMIAALFTACSGNETAGDSEKLKIVSTIFPEYDWVRQILGDDAEDADLTLLIDNGVDLHSYQPTTEDIVKISTCDVFIYVGGESDAWVEDALKSATNKDMIVIDLLDVLGDLVKEEEAKEGMEQDDDHEQESFDPEVELDEHVWLSLKNAEVLCTYIADKLGELDPENADAYIANAAQYNDKLNDLDGEVRQTVNSAAYKTLLFGDRFPFRYLVDDYGLDYYAAFSGCSAETEASFETIVFLANKVDELGLGSVMVIETSDQAIAKTIIENTKDKNQKILVLNSLQGVTTSDITSGMTYLSVMESNLEVLKEALN